MTPLSALRPELRLEEITPANFTSATSIRVRTDQEFAVSPVMRSLAGSVFRSGLWRLNIAADEQGKGYGRFAVESVAAELRRRGTKELYVTWHEGPNGPAGFYLGLGFRTNGETSGGETVGVLDLG